MNRTDSRARIRRVGSCIERRVFDRVAHADNSRLAEGLDVEEGAAVFEPELSVQRVVHLVVHVHVLVNETDVELQRLHDRRHIVAFNPHEAPHAMRVDRARAHAEQHVFVHDGYEPLAVRISKGLCHACILSPTP